MDISPYILEILAKDLDPEVRRIVASVKNTPEYILDILAKDSNETVRERARKNPNYNGIMNKIKKYLS